MVNFSLFRSKTAKSGQLFTFIFQKVVNFYICFFETGQLCKRKIVRNFSYSHKFVSSHRYINVVELRILLVFIPEFDFSTQNINVEKRLCHEPCNIISLALNINSGPSVVRSTFYRYLSVSISFTYITIRAYLMIWMPLNFRPSFLHTNVLSEKVKGPATIANPFGFNLYREFSYTQFWRQI